MKSLLFLIFSCVLMAQEPVAVTDAAAIQAKVEQEITVRGVPNAKSAKSKSGHFFYNFDNTNFTVFCYRASAEKFPEEKHPASLVGKTIKVTGKVTEYKGKLQIAIREAAQIEVVAATPPPADPTKKDDDTKDDDKKEDDKQETPKEEKKD